MGIGQLTTGGDYQDKMVLEMIVMKIVASIVNMLGMDMKLITTSRNYTHYPVWISSKRFNILLHLCIKSNRTMKKFFDYVFYSMTRLMKLTIWLIKLIISAPISRQRVGPRGPRYQVPEFHNSGVVTICKQQIWEWSQKLECQKPLLCLEWESLLGPPDNLLLPILDHTIYLRNQLFCSE